MFQTPQYLGKFPHLSVGVRLPEVFLEGILTGFKLRNSAGGVMLSFHRETAPEKVINAPSGIYEITRGHTGTSIKRYIELSVLKAKEKGVVVEVEADHVSVSVSSEAVKRISGGGTHRVLSDFEVESALKYIEEEVLEATTTGNINFYTIDTCDLIDHSVDTLSKDEIETRFKDMFGSSDVATRYTNIDVTIGGLTLKFSEEDVKRLSLKLLKSIEVAEKIYHVIKNLTPWRFGVEIAFDETPSVTKPEELFFVLNELKNRGIPVDFIAPNVGFLKREDYTGSLNLLYNSVKLLAEIATRFNTYLSFHSGSGSNPYSMKGTGVHETIRRATNGFFKYKVSGVYYELLMHIMSRYPSPRVQRLFEEVYDSIIEFLEKQVQEKGELYDKVLEGRLEEYRQRASTGRYRNVEAAVFRYYSFLALNLRRDGQRYFRESIVQLYQENEDFRKKVDKELSSFTVALIDSLGFNDNIRYLF